MLAVSYLCLSVWFVGQLSCCLSLLVFVSLVCLSSTWLFVCQISCRLLVFSVCFSFALSTCPSVHLSASSLLGLYVVQWQLSGHETSHIIKQTRPVIGEGKLQPNRYTPSPGISDCLDSVYDCRAMPSVHPAASRSKWLPAISTGRKDAAGLSLHMPYPVDTANHYADGHVTLFILVYD